MNRSQMRLSLILIPLECFIPVATDTDVEMPEYDYSTSYPSLQVIYEDFSDIWVNVRLISLFTQGEKTLYSETCLNRTLNKTRFLYKLNPEKKNRM